jgi:CHAT domain-containing protein
LADFYARVGGDEVERLLEAKDAFERALRIIEGDYAKGISEFERSRDLFARLGDDAEAAVAEMWAAQFLPDVARVAEGRRRLTALIEQAAVRKFGVIAAPAYYWLGVGDFGQGGLSRTSRNFKAALRLAEAGANAFEMQHAREALASYYSDLGELEPALAYAGLMLPDADTYYQSPRQSWREKGTLSDLSLKLKFFAASLSFSEEALAIAREDAPDSSRVNSNLRHLADAAAAMKDFGAALRYAEESRALALSRDDGAENRRTAAEALTLLADVKSETGDCDAALSDYDRALELYGRLPELTAGSYRIHKGRLFCFQRLGRHEDFAAELKTVLAKSEEYRASLREDESRRAFFSDERAVFDAAASEAHRAGDARGAFALVEASRARSLLEFVESDRMMEEVERDFASVARPLSPEEIRARLPEGLQVVEYEVLPDRLLTWVVSRSRFDVYERALAADELEAKVEAYRAAVVAKAPAPAVGRAAAELYEILIPPGLDAGQAACLVPDKSLHQLPFASLVSPSGKYLIEEFVLSYAPSASVLVLATENARRRERAEESLLSVGNPDFDREENPGLADLRAAGEEAKAVAAAGYARPTELTGAEATKERFLRGFEGVGVIHFAGHFVANRQSPGNSKLLFAGGELRASELGAHKLPVAKLVVLSACETGFERYDKSEGAVGIARTFLALGSPLVVASQWKVDSETTRDLMTSFHLNRKRRGLTTAESLRQSQLEALRAGRTAAPFYWAAFSLYGGHARY